MPDERDKRGMEKREVSLPATSAKEAASLKSRAPFASGDEDAFLQKLSAENPALRALLTATTKEARAKILSLMDKQRRQTAFASLISLGFQFKKRSRHAEALTLARINYEVAASDSVDRLDSFLDHTQPRNLGDVMQSIGEIQYEMGEYSQALSSCLEAEARYQDDERLRRQAGRTKPSEIDLLFGGADFRSANFALIAEVYAKLGEPKASDEFNRKAWQSSKRRADPDESRFDELISMAKGARNRGDLNLALGVYWQALKLSKNLPLSFVTGADVVEPLAATGMIYADLGLNRRALELFEEARKLNELSGHLGRLLADHANIAEIHAARGDTHSAIASFRQALVCASRKVTDQSLGQTALVWRSGNESYQLVQLESAWRLLLSMARLERTHNRQIAQGQLELAVRVIEHLRTRIVQEERRVGYQTPSMEVYDELVDLLAEEYEERHDKACLEDLFSTIERAKARVLYEMLADQPIAKPLRTPDQLIQQEMFLLQHIEKLQKSMESGGSSFEIIDQLGAANERLKKVWEEIARSDPDEGPEYVSLRQAEVVSCDDIRETLRSSGNLRVVVANYYLARNRLISVCLYSDKPDLSYHSEPIVRDEVRKWALVNPADPPSADLRLPYWFSDFPSITTSPIVNAIAGYDVVCLALHDVLHSLPFHAFPIGSTSMPLVGQSTVSYVPSASILRFCLRRRKPNVGNSLVVGNPHRPDQAPIPRSEIEANTIAALLNCEAITGAAATRATVVAKGAQADYLHLACHCKFYRDDPLNSALMLSNGNLTARDIFAWRLNPELVVLSACESGVSKVQAGDELIGLVRALLFSGTPSIIVSLWNAYDGSTAEIMEDFYRAHITEKKSMALALADAQRIQIRKGAAAAQWAPFVLIGDWR